MTIRILQGDCRDVLRTLPDASVHCVVTSPPYWGLRDYGVAGQIGLEPTYGEYVKRMVEIFRDVRRVLRADGTLWLNLGDSYSNSDKGGYAKDRVTATDSMQRSNLGANFIGAPNRQPQAGLKPKDLCGIPWRVAFALQDDGWWLRQDIIWSKPNPMPESVTDRCTKAHEYLFMLAKSERYFYDQDAIAEPAVYAGDERHLRSDNTQVEREKPKQDGHSRRHAGFNSRYFTGSPQAETRNKRSVWTVTTQPFSEAHFGTFRSTLIEPCILAGCPKGGTVLDPFFGAGTTGLVADRLGRDCIGIELNPAFVEMARKRIQADAGMFAEVSS